MFQVAWHTQPYAVWKLSGAGHNSIDLGNASCKSHRSWPQTPSGSNRHRLASRTALGGGLQQHGATKTTSNLDQLGTWLVILLIAYVMSIVYTNKCIHIYIYKYMSSLHQCLFIGNISMDLDQDTWSTSKCGSKCRTKPGSAVMVMVMLLLLMMMMMMMMMMHDDDDDDDDDDGSGNGGGTWSLLSFWCFRGTTKSPVKLWVLYLTVRTSTRNPPNPACMPAMLLGYTLN